MDNKQKRVFPGLMAGKKILYVHGFASSARSGTVALLRSLVPSAEVVARDVPVDPREAMAMLRALCEAEQPDLVIGTSAGGMMAEMLYGYDRILVNPAFEMGATMLSHGMLGRMAFQNPREDGQTEFMVTKALVKLYAETAGGCFAHAGDYGEQDRVWGLFGDKDPVVHTFPLFRQHYSNAIMFHGEHRLVDPVAIHYLIPLIRWIDDRQEGRERPVLYICIDAMRDGHGRPMASMHKAVEMLLEHYSVHFVCPSPAYGQEAISEDMLWIEDVISSPSWRRITFTNDPSLLLGDFIISTQVPGPILGSAHTFMGTHLRLGSAELKTWDDLIVFFSRLGGA